MDRPYFVVLADDHALVRRGIKKIIEENPELEVIAEEGDGLEVLDYLRKNVPSPDMVIMDISMPHMGGIEATAEIKEHYPEIKVLILTMHKDKEYLNQALAKGADGYLVKQEVDTELFAAISTIRHGDIYICPLMR
jgi:DNA-binding NarL/FixJ family response regulator